MKQLNLILILLLLLVVQKMDAQIKQPFPILFWNVENLFDYRTDSTSSDKEFSPTSLKRWTKGRYYKKLNNLAKGVVATSGWSIPAIIGLCEIENDSVLFDLTHRSRLRNLDYKYICSQSKDQRGINTAILYQPHRFKPIKTESKPIGKLPNGRYTRDILYLKGVTQSLDTLNIFVLHLPSRYGGQKYSEPNRLYVINILKEELERQFINHPSPKVIIMGDFNDYPSNKAVKSLLNTKHKTLSYEHILSYKKGEGTYKYKNEWGILDHFIISSDLLDNESTLYTAPLESKIVSLPFLFIKDKKYGGLKPLRSYNGMHYLGGYSDHLPILIILTELLY